MTTNIDDCHKPTASENFKKSLFKIKKREVNSKIESESFVYSSKIFGCIWIRIRCATISYSVWTLRFWGIYDSERDKLSFFFVIKMPMKTGNSWNLNKLRMFLFIIIIFEILDKIQLKISLLQHSTHRVHGTLYIWIRWTIWTYLGWVSHITK